MSDKISMNYEQVDDMIRALQQAIEQLQNTNTETDSIAAALEDGALIGDGGAAMCDALRGRLSPAVDRLIERFEQMIQMVEREKQQLMDADRRSGTLFQ